jgi:hypothetical protein
MPKNLQPTAEDIELPQKTKRKKIKSPKLLPRKPAVFDRLSPDLPVGLTINTAVDTHGHHTGNLLVTAKDKRGNLIRATLPVKELALGRCESLADFAVQAKLTEHLSPKGLRTFAAMLIEHTGSDVYIALRPGFHWLEIQGQRYGFYVTGYEVHHFGIKPPLAVVVDHKVATKTSSGDIESWNAAIGVHLAVNPYMLVSVLAALASAIARAFGLPIPILVIVAPSSVGKTTLQQVGRSTWERADKISDASGTANGLRVKMEQHADAPFFLQDVHEAEDIAGFMPLLFLVANGGQRLTSTSDQKISTGEELACGLSLSTELTFMELVGSKKISLPEGFAARCFEMVLQAPHGAFHQVPQGVEAHDFANQLKRACSEHYGATWEAWIPAIAKHAEKLRDWLPEHVKQAEIKLLEGLAIRDRVTLRLVSGLAVWVAVGWLAVKVKVLKIKSESVTEAVRLVLREHVSRQTHNTTPIGEKVISTVRNLIDRNSNRFPALTMFDRNDQSQVLGYTKGNGKDRVYLFLPGALEDILGEKFGLQMALQKLDEAGYLLKNGEGWQMQVRLGDQRKRFYAIRSGIRFDGDPETEEAN